MCFDTVSCKSLSRDGGGDGDGDGGSVVGVVGLLWLPATDVS